MPTLSETTNSCAAGKWCKAPPGVPVGSMHICAKCNTPVHAPGFGCCEEWESISANIKRKLSSLDGKAPPKRGMNHEICAHCIESTRTTETTSTESSKEVIGAAKATSSDKDKGVNSDPITIDLTTEETEGNPPAEKPPAEKPPAEKPPAEKPPAKKPLWLPLKGKQPTGPKKPKQAVLKPIKEKPHKKSSSVKQATKAGKEVHTIKQKLKILREWDETQNGTGRKNSVAAKYNVHVTTIRRWKNKEESLKAAYEESGRGEKKTLHTDYLKRIVHGLELFYEANERMPRDLKLPLTGAVLSAQAMKIKKRILHLHVENKLRVPLSDEELASINEFEASQSWVSKKSQSLGWKSVVLHGEAGDVDVEGVAAKINEIRAKIRTYHPDNVYNMDETGLQYKCLPNRSYVKRVKVKTARGTKMMKVKDRVTIYVTTNASGTDFVPLSIIGKSGTPACFRGHELKLTYYNQKKAWSDTATFKKWWFDFLKHIKKRTNDRVLLILDNCGPHCGKAEEFMNDPQVEVIMLPPNCTSMYQPMDSGVIAMIKKNYRFRLLSMYLDMFEVRKQLRQNAIDACMKRGTKGLKEGYAPHIRDCMDILHEIQKEVEEASLFNCWRKSTLLDQPDYGSNTAPSVSDAIAEAWSLIDEKLGSNSSEKENTNNAEALQMVAALSEMVSNEKQPKKSDSDGNDEINEVELILDEFVTTTKEHCQNRGDLDEMLEGWVGMEDTEVVRQDRYEEVQEEIDDAFEKELADVEEVDSEEEEDDDVEMVDDPEEATFELITDISSQLSKHAAKVKNLKCEENEFDGAASLMTDAASALMVAYRKLKRNEGGKKQKRQLRQGGVQAFLNKVPKTSS